MVCCVVFWLILLFFFFFLLLLLVLIGCVSVFFRHTIDLQRAFIVFWYYDDAVLILINGRSGIRTWKLMLVENEPPNSHPKLIQRNILSVIAANKLKIDNIGTYLHPYVRTYVCM